MGLGGYGLFLLGSAVYAFVVGMALGAGAWIAWRLLERRRATGPAPAPGAGWMLWILIPVAIAWTAWSVVVGPSLLPGSDQAAAMAVLQVVPLAVMLTMALAGIWLVRRALRS